MLLQDGSINTRSNNLNLIRLLAAISVTFGHSFPMYTGSAYKLFDVVSSGAFGYYAVAIFFGLSGFLITQSYFRNSNWKIYLRARILRLAPGFFFANFITALMIVYLIKNDSLLNYLSEFFIYTIGGTIFFFSHSFPDAYPHLNYNSPNGSMWTLTYEFRMYILVLILGTIGLLRNRKAFTIFAAFLVALSLTQIDTIYTPIFNLLFRIKNHDSTFTALPFSFGLGMLAYLFKDKVRISILWSTVILIASFFTDYWPFKIVAWIYFVFSFGYDPRFYLPRLNFRNDISYGVYILSWPIQQSALHLKWPNSSLELFFISMAFIIPLSLASWKYVEEPCLKWKKPTAKVSEN